MKNKDMLKYHIPHFVAMFVALCLVVVIGCTQSKDLSGIGSKSINIVYGLDDVKELLTSDAVNTWAYDELDAIQRDIKYALAGDITSLKVRTLYERSIQVYAIFKLDVVERWETIPEADQIRLESFDRELQLLSYDITSFLNDPDNTEFVDVANTVLDVSNLILNFYKVYKHEG